MLSIENQNITWGLIRDPSFEGKYLAWIETQRNYIGYGKKLDKDPTTSCLSLTTEKQSNSHSNLSMPSLISDLDLPSPLSAFSVEIEDIFNFELEEILDTPEEKKEIDSEAAFRPIPLEGSHSDKGNIQTVEDTTIVTSTQSEVELQRKEELDNTPPTGSQAQNNSPPHQEPQHNPGETGDLQITINARYPHQ